MPCGWEGNQRSGIALATCQTFVIFHLWAWRALEREMSTRLRSLSGVRQTLPLSLVALWGVLGKNPFWYWGLRCLMVSGTCLPRCFNGSRGHKMAAVITLHYACHTLIAVKKICCAFRRSLSKAWSATWPICTKPGDNWLRQMAALMLMSLLWRMHRLLHHQPCQYTPDLVRI